MTTLQDKLDNIYQTKLEIKSAIGTDSDVFSEYPAMIRSMSGGGVSYSYLDERLSYYVETADLEAMGYATESYVTNAISNIPGVDLSSYVTYTYLESKEYLTEIPATYATYAAISEMGYITYSYGDSIYVSYAYIGDLNEITEYILGSSNSEAPENVYATKYELGSYVSKDELDNASYITQQVLDNASYATESYVTNAISNIPSVDTSSYVTYTYLESKEYLTEIPNTYATYAAISEMGYLTSNDLPVINENIIPKESSTYTLGDSSYIYDTTYTNTVYFGTTGSCIFNNGTNGLDFVRNGTSVCRIYGGTNAALMPTSNKNRNLGTNNYRWNNTYTENIYTTYINSYAVTDFATTSQIPVINENIVPKENNTYTLGDSSYLYKATYSSASYLTSNNALYAAASSQVNLDLGNKRFAFSTGALFASANTALGKSDRYWSSTYTSNLYTENISYTSSKTSIKMNDRNLDLWTNNKKLINLSDYNGFVPMQSNFNLGSSDNAWGTTYTNNLYVNGSDIEARIAAIEAYLGLNQ